jgi:hypothetical protein
VLYTFWAHSSLRAARKAMDDAQIPEITKNFIAANKDLRQSPDVIGQNQKLKTEVTSYQKQLGEVAIARAKEAGVIQDLRDQLQAATIEQTQLRNKIAKLDGDSRQFPVKINTAEKLGGGYAVGVKDGHPNFLEVTFDNKSYQLSAGNSLPTFDIGGKHCFVILLDFVWYSPATGNFELSCKPITP